MPVIDKISFTYYRPIVKKGTTKKELSTRPRRPSMKQLHEWYPGMKPLPDAEGNEQEVFSNGGRTDCTITLDSGEQFQATAWCSFADSFSPKRGKEISYGRCNKAVREYQELYNTIAQRQAKRALHPEVLEEMYNVAG